ncbi:MULTISPECIES: DUF1847 domain-containing protein [Ruminococcus]|uniref:Metal-binding protein n=1 Tax=Ruminococcus albus 8 TaxID=246199 RepID=E9S8H3_RUMAL|nr:MULTISPECIES: DUF1847 domain-containing protein [Ruminococcus]MBE6872834.1 DUF1847 domain-containing protein [Ruminococcus albus]EGC04421.1 hypothetical protein CUS_5312 [Ruminococcus albus 8]MBQ9542968.1 DUF1847 domain-containing protein [Ruminococcus sp.]MBR0530722.1 DUF1847 domain-containing protein [Ruminococcus sp.]MCC3351482.1 DUF1847 domain-containing protein [Ruminococcus albus 8]
MANENICRSCADCGVMNCLNRKGKYPEFCPTAELTEEEIDEVVALYTNSRINKKVSIASAEIEGEFYGKYTRVEEIIEFARRIGAKKIGIATCVGLIEESRIFAKILRLNGFEVYGISCKVGSVNKTTIGVDEKYTCVTGPVMCNPIMQAKLLAKAKVDLNVVVGLCVGHDSLFYKYAKGLTTTLITKDRMLAHNPAGALYQARAYYKKLLHAPVGEELDRSKLSPGADI